MPLVHETPKLLILLGLKRISTPWVAGSILLGSPVHSALVADRLQTKTACHRGNRTGPLVFDLEQSTGTETQYLVAMRQRYEAGKRPRRCNNHRRCTAWALPEDAIPPPMPEWSAGISRNLRGTPGGKTTCNRHGLCRIIGCCGPVIGMRVASQRGV
jgi:hypothetical protein